MLSVLLFDPRALYLMTKQREPAPRPRIVLQENGEGQTIHLATHQVAALQEIGLVEVRLTPVRGMWQIIPRSLVGVVRVGNLEIEVRPKVPIRNVLHLLTWGEGHINWNRQDAELETTDDLFSALVAAFELELSRALRQGILQGYRQVDETSTVIRGRLRMRDQIRRHHHLLYPAEVTYDDYNVDTSENRLLLSAIHACKFVPRLSPHLRQRIRHLEARLEGVTLCSAAYVLGSWEANRLNNYLVPALRLAEMILRSISFGLGRGGVKVSGFTLDLARIFENFVGRVIQDKLKGDGFTASIQDSWMLVEGGQVSIRPDIVLYPNHDMNRPVAVLDTKYMDHGASGSLRNNLYQMVTYCLRLGLRQGTLIYAHGEGDTRYDITGTGMSIYAAPIDLAIKPALIEIRIHSIVERVLRDNDGRSGSDHHQHVALA